MDFETAYLALLGQSRFYSARADTLTIFGPTQRDAPRVRRRAREPAARPLGRRLVLERPGLGRRRRCPAPSSTSCSGSATSAGFRRLQPVQRHVRHERQRRPHRPAGHDAPRLRRRRDGPGDRLPRGAPGRRPDRGADAAPSPCRTSTARPTCSSSDRPRRPRAPPRRRGLRDAQAHGEGDREARPRSPRRSRRASRRPRRPRSRPRPRRPPPPPTFAPDVAHVPAQHGRRRQGRQDHVPRELVHGDDPGGPQCQYFDPAPITVPADPSTLVTAVMASSSDTTFADAVTAATDATVWDVTAQRGPHAERPRRDRHRGDGDRRLGRDPRRDLALRLPRGRRLVRHGHDVDGGDRGGGRVRQRLDHPQPDGQPVEVHPRAVGRGR